MKKILILFAFLISIGSHAMDSLKVARMPTYRYYVYGATFFPNSETTLRVDGKLAGTYIDLENDLNLRGKSVSFRMEGLAQVSPRSSISLTYFSIFRSNNATLQRDITYNDTTFKAGVNVQSFFNIRFMGASYRYSVFYDKNWSLGLTAGLRVLNVDAGISLTRNSGSNYSNQFSTFIPVALFGIHGSAYVTPRLLARYSFEFFGLTVNGINGRVIDNRLTLEYYILKNFSLGGSFTNIKYSVKDFPISDRFDGSVSYSVSGFSVFIGARF